MKSCSRKIGGRDNLGLNNHKRCIDFGSQENQRLIDFGKPVFVPANTEVGRLRIPNLNESQTVSYAIPGEFVGDSSTPDWIASLFPDWVFPVEGIDAINIALLAVGVVGVGAASVGLAASMGGEVLIKELHAKIGQLTVEKDFLQQAFAKI